MECNKRRSCLISVCVMIVTVLIAVALWFIISAVLSEPLKTTFMTRCQNYKNENSATTSQIDCEKIWDSFKQAFVGKNPCDVRPEAYDSLMKTAFRNPARDRMILWSKTDEIAHEFTKEMWKRKCYLSLEDTLLGYILDRLDWCGKNDSQKTFTTRCPACKNNYPVRSFWNRISAEFAASACGEVSVMLNGSIDESFNTSSTFAKVEVNNFNPSIMKSLKVLLVTKETDTKTCESDASLKKLQKQLDPKIKYSCEVLLLSKIQCCMNKQETQDTCVKCW